MTFDVSDHLVNSFNYFMENYVLGWAIVIGIIILLDLIHIGWVYFYHGHWDIPWEYDYLEDMRFPAHHDCHNGLIGFLIVFDIIYLIILPFIVFGYLNGVWRW